MSLTFTATIIVMLAFLMGTVTWSVWKGTLTSRPVLVMLPALAISIAAISLVVEAGNSLLPWAVILMTVSASGLLLSSAALMVMEAVAQRHRKPKHEDDMGDIETKK